MVDMAALPATFTSGQARAAGVHPRDLYRWRDQELVMELSRGVFRRVDVPFPTYSDLLGVAARVPVAVVCLVSAASVHDLTDEIPAWVQIAVPRTSRPPRISYPPVQVYRFDVPTFELGLARVEAAEGEWVRIYSPARTVVDLMRFRHRIGESVAHIALRRYLGRRGARPGELVDLARSLGVLGPIRSAVELLQAS
jgi:hypothetical protein